MAKAAAERRTAEVGTSDSNQRQLEKALKKAEWQLHDVTAMKDAKWVQVNLNLGWNHSFWLTIE